MLKTINRFNLFVVVLFIIAHVDVFAKELKQVSDNVGKADPSSLYYVSERTRRIPRQATDKSMKPLDQAPLFQLMSNDLPTNEKMNKVFIYF